MNKFKKTFLLLAWLVALSLQAGPKGYFKNETGALVRGEVIYADEVFYYYQRVSNPGEIFTVKIEDVPISFRRIADRLRLKGGIGEPPESIAKVEPVEEPYGEWKLIEKLDRDIPIWRIAVLSTNDDQGRVVNLIIRRYKGNYGRLYQEEKNIIRLVDILPVPDMPESDTLEFDILLDFGDVVTRVKRWQVSYQFDDNDPTIESWILSECNTGLFAQTSLGFGRKLLKAKYVTFSVNDNEGETRCFRFEVSHIEKVYEGLSQPIITDESEANFWSTRWHRPALGMPNPLWKCLQSSCQSCGKKCM